MAPRSSKKPKSQEQQPLPPPQTSTDTEQHDDDSVPDSDITTAPKRSHVEMITTKKRKASVPRVWTNEEEITLLRAMNDYKNQKGADPISKFASLYEDKLKGMFENVFLIEQVRSKMKNLRRRFVNARDRCQDGAEPVYSKPHDCLVYDLSKNIWADYSVPVKTNVSVKNKIDDALLMLEEKEVEAEDEEEPGSFRAKYRYVCKCVDDVCGNFPSLGLNGRVLIDCFSLIGTEDEAKEWDNQCKKLHMEEMELRDQMKAFLRKHSMVG